MTTDSRHDLPPSRASVLSDLLGTTLCHRPLVHPIDCPFKETRTAILQSADDCRSRWLSTAGRLPVGETAPGRFWACRVTPPTPAIPLTRRRTARVGLTDDEFEQIRTRLGREPNHLELAMYSVMWSEHCSYKSSRIHLRRFPTEAPWVLVGPGEGAGVIDVGDGIAAAIRIESHNHPSAIEPYQGAATGVGGILRDIFSMGARPIAVMDPLRLGPLDDARSRWIAEGVVSGISGYGNSVGVPTVGGETVFDECYADNPLVNVLCLGADADRSSGARPRRGCGQPGGAARVDHRS